MSNRLDDSLKCDQSTHFEFGRNWADYSKSITADEISDAKIELGGAVCDSDLSENPAVQLLGLGKETIHQKRRAQPASTNNYLHVSENHARRSSAKKSAKEDLELQVRHARNALEVGCHRLARRPSL